MSSLNNQNKKLYVAWIDKNIFNSENKKYLEQIGYLGYKPEKYTNNQFDQETMIDIQINIKDKIFPYITRAFQDIKSSIFYLKGDKSEFAFKKTIIIVSGRLFKDFVKEFDNNLKDIYFIPKIIVFTNRNFNYPNGIPNKEFYQFGGYKNNFSEIKYILDSEVEKMEKYPPYQPQPSSELNNSKTKDELIFDPVKDIRYIAIQTYYKIYIDLSNLGKNKEFINKLYEKYIFNVHYVELLDQIKDFKNIPVELLSKYYIRLYTIDGDFYRKMKIELLDGEKEYYKPYIKTLYAGVEKEALKKYINAELYSAQKLSPEQIKDLNDSQKNRVQDLPISILFSKAFISFSKELSTAETFLNSSDKNAILTVVKFENDFDLQTHADIENLSAYATEKEVLFFPFSTFGINNFTYDNQKKRYELELIYFGKFLKDKRFNNITKNLPETKFKTFFDQSGLNKTEENYNLNKIKISDLNKNYDTYIESKLKKCNKKYFLFLLLLLLLPLIALIKKKSGGSDNKKTTTTNCKGGTYLDLWTSEC